MKDDYISVEHLLLGIIDETHNTQLAAVLKVFQITRETVLQALTKVRGQSTSDQRYA